MHFHLTSSIIFCQSLHIDFARRQDFFIYTGNIAARYFLHNKKQPCIRKTIPKTPAKNPRSHNINLAGLSVPI